MHVSGVGFEIVGFSGFMQDLASDLGVSGPVSCETREYRFLA